VIESCVVVHCGADYATSAPQIFFYNDKLRFGDPTTKHMIALESCGDKML